jgi:glycosyltransferase involved in cell wall biosynthesis
MKKKSIWFVWTAALNTPRLTKIAEELDKNKYEVTIVYWDREFSGQGLEDSIAKFGNQFNLIPIKTGYAPYGKGVFSIGNRIKYSRGLKKLIKSNINNIDLLYVCDFDSGFPLRNLMKNFKGISYFDIADYIETFKSPIPVILRRIIKKLYLKIYDAASYIVLPDINRLGNIPQKFHYKVKYINNAPNISLSDIENLDINMNKDKTNIAYYGGFSEERGIDFLLELAMEFGDKIDFYFAGWGQLQPKIEQIAKKYDNVHFIGKLTQNQALGLLDKVDLSYIVYDPKFEHNQIASPNKMFEAFMIGRPIIVANNTSIDKVVEQKACGFVVNYDLNEIRNLLKNIETYDFNVLANNASKAYDEYSWENSPAIC